MKTIAIVDLSTGRTQECRRNTLTLDIPHDLDWATGGVSVDANSVGHYFAAGGQRLVYATRPLTLVDHLRAEPRRRAARLIGLLRVASSHARPLGDTGGP